VGLTDPEFVKFQNKSANAVISQSNVTDAVTGQLGSQVLMRCVAAGTVIDLT
jgi:hypothetical protein